MGRQYSCDCGYDAETEKLLGEAAAEIERLKEVVTRLHAEKREQKAEVEQLRSALQQIIERYAASEEGWPAEDMRAIARDALERKP